MAVCNPGKSATRSWSSPGPSKHSNIYICAICTGPSARRAVHTPPEVCLPCVGLRCYHSMTATGRWLCPHFGGLT